MTKARLLLTTGITLIAGAMLLLCSGLAGLADVPYQDPTPAMTAEQAARTAAAERRAAICAGVAAVLAVTGVATLVVRSRRYGRSAR